MSLLDCELSYFRVLISCCAALYKDSRADILPSYKFSPCYDYYCAAEI